MTFDLSISLITNEKKFMKFVWSVGKERVVLIISTYYQG